MADFNHYVEIYILLGYCNKSNSSTQRITVEKPSILEIMRHSTDGDATTPTQGLITSHM